MSNHTTSRRHRMRQRVVGSLLGLLVAPALLAGQASLDRPPNLLGTWVPAPAVLQFNFLHRFYVSPGPSRSVLNFPTFTFALGLPQRIALGTRYSTRAETPGKTNEIEVFARWRVLSGGPSPIAVAVTPAWDGSSKSVNGELSGDWTRRDPTLSGAVRGMTQPFGAKPAKAALAGGAVLRLNNYVALGGDVASILSPDSTEKAAWSAGLLFVIPGSPHTFSLHASNVMVNTTEGSSKRGSFFGVAKVVYGFEFTIPIHFARFAPSFHGNAKPAVVGNAVPAAPDPVAAQVQVRAAWAPGGFASPFPAAGAYERLVPYRSNRSRLNVATHQDYEMTVLRLLAGERGYAQLDPADVGAALRREMGEPSPDTALFRQFPDAQLSLNRLAAERFLRGDKAYAPPPPPPLRVEDSEDEEEPAGEPSRREISSSHFALEVQADAAPTRQCPYCGGVLPAHHKVNFCPHCGQPPSGELKCPACGSEVDVGWAYCVSCGRATGFE